MSDQEPFLTRWSRRKRKAEEAEPEPAKTAEEDGALAQTAAAAESEKDDEPVQREQDGGEPPVDLSKLPPIESITAATDIRAFLAPGVPVELTRAALRRVWAADPAIRDFVGLAENAWDFTAPGGVPGFGPLQPGEAVASLLADAAHKVDAALASPAATAAETVQGSQVSAKREVSGAAPSLEESPAPRTSEQDPVQLNESNAAVQKQPVEEERPTKTARLHGGALPR